MNAARALPLALLSACATGRVVDADAFAARGPEQARILSGLRSMYTLQMEYQARNDRFATEVDELREVGWSDRDWGDYRPAVIDAGSRLCVAMLPTRSRRVAWSMAGDRRLYRSPRCGR